jgi:phospholipid/cholesterol/gamma-HCH transport system ATP-binding protein
MSAAANGQPPPQSVLRFEDVSLAFDETVALDHVSFEQAAGETRVVLGSAGSGKTALLKTAIGLLKPDSGRVWLLGEEITSRSEHDLFRLRSRVGVLFQEGGLFDSLTVGENVAYPLENQQVGKTAAPEEIERRVEDALRFVELEQTLDRFPNELSGGMRRRVGIARAAVTEPPLVLYDSPTAGLDPITANTIVALIAKERDLRDTANLMVTHRYQDGEIMANFRYNPDSGRLVPAAHAAGSNGLRTMFMVLEGGRLVFEGSQKELEASNDPYVTRFIRL